MSVLRKVDNIMERLDAHGKILRAMELASSYHYASDNYSLMEDVLLSPLNTREEIKEFNQKNWRMQNWLNR